MVRVGGRYTGKDRNARHFLRKKGEYNLAYDDDLDGVVNQGAVPTMQYAEMYFNGNSTAMVLETASTPVGVRQIETGLLDGWTFDAGSTGGITAYADYDGTVAGTTKVTDAAHGLATGDVISIRGTTNYNGVYAVTVIGDDDFYIVEAYVADDGASDWDQASSLIAGSAAAGKYDLSYDLTFLEATGGSTITFVPYVGVTAFVTGKSEEVGETTINTTPGGCILTVAAGDVVFLTASSSGTNNITISEGNIRLKKL